MRNLRRIELTNINNLTFENFGLTWNPYIQLNNDYFNLRQNVPTLKIQIENCRVNKIGSYTFQGQISDISFKNSYIEDMTSFAFSSLLQTENISFSNVTFNSVQSQSFKKFNTYNLIISDSTFNVLPSRSFNDITVFDTFKIQNTSFDTIRSSAFVIQAKSFEIINSQINVVEGEAFKVTTKGNVKIRSNVFNVTQSGAFFGISLNKEATLTEEEILFHSNTFYSLEKDSFKTNISSFSTKFVNNIVNQECDCKLTNYYEGNPDEFYCMFQNKSLTVKEFKSHSCSILQGYSTVIIVVSVVLLLFILISMGLIFYFRRTCRKTTEYLTDKNGKPISLIMPDGRTYRETELHVVVERADLLTTDL